VFDHRERCDGEGGSVLSDDGEEGDPGADDCDGQQDSDAVPGGFVGGVSAAAGGCVSGPGRLWARVSQQRGDERGGRAADYSDHGDVRGGWSVSAGDDGYGADDGGVGIIFSRAGAGAGSDWAEDAGGGAGRSADACGDLGDGRLQGEG